MRRMADSLVARHQEVGPLLTERAQRARLLEAMVQVVAEKGYDAATVADAVRRARVSRGTFYALFDSKQSCLVAAFRLGTEVLEERIDAAIAGAKDWREELRLGLRAYLHTLAEEPRFARIYLIESEPLRAEREAAIRRFAKRYGRTFARSGRPVPPEGALYLLSAGVGELARATVHAGENVTDLEDTLVGCAVRLATEEEPWT
jgi:AcrR family transcriptional regulator